MLGIISHTNDIEWGYTDQINQTDYNLQQR